jgi:hypothetical protein
MNTLSNLKVAFASAVVAVVLTVAMGSAFVNSTSVARVYQPAAEVIRLAASN